MPPKKRPRLTTRKGHNTRGKSNPKKEKVLDETAPVEVLDNQQEEFVQPSSTSTVMDVEIIEHPTPAAVPEAMIIDIPDDENPDPVVKSGIVENQITDVIPECRCFQPRTANDLCPIHEMDMIADDAVPGFFEEDPITILTPNVLRELEIPFPIENNNDDPVDNEFVEVEAIPVVNPNPQNVQDRQNDEIDRQETEADIERIRNRDAQIATYLRATERNNVPIHSAGMMDQVCRHCDARFFLQEKTIARQEYNKCCNNGKVQLPPLGQHPPRMVELFLGQHRRSGEFKRNILYYNNCFQFVSIEASLRNLPGYGPYVYSIYGKIYHHITNINVNRENYKYSPLYFLDPQQAVEQRLNNVNQPLNRQLMMLITEDLQRVNPFARQYRHMHNVYEQERLRMENENIEVPRVCLEFVGHHRDRNNREHDLPEVNEVAIVANYDENNPPNPRMHVFLTNQDDGMRTLEQTSEFADPLSFPLLFPNGDLGWNDNIPLENRRARQQRERVTLCQFYAYRLSYRHNNGNFQIFEHGGKLMQQFIVHAYLKIEANRINYFLLNQNLLRAEEYVGLVDYLHNRAEVENVPIGQRVILPSTFEMSPRNQMQRYQDAMTVCSEIGNPSLFITFTCNPKWPEIVDNLPPGEEVTNHPMLVDRVFKMKLDELMIDLTKRYILGVCIAHLQVIEFQKRGLPHAHILITLRNEDRPFDPIRIDQLICAEIPDQETEPELHTLVGRHMIHGPCGEHNPRDICMVDNKCIRNFPKYWYNNTTIRDGRVSYRRRQNGRKIEMRRNNRHYSVDSRFVVPYNPYLLLKYRTHINIEACTNTGTVKYLYKYFFKASDQALLRIVENQNDNGENNPELRYNEIHSYLNGRYMTAPEASWRILKMPMHENSHTVIRLPIHLPGRQRVFFRRNGEEAVAEREAKTQLTQWFELNRTDPDARQYLYRQIPLHYVWDKSNKRWKKRQRFFEKTVSRMYNISVRNGELYYLRLLLLRVRGATSFEALKTVNGQMCETFQEACLELNLLAEDREWVRCLTEAREREMPKQMRQMFAYILVFCIVNNPIQLWNQFKQFMMEDYTRQNRMNEREAEIRTLQKIQFILMVNGRRLSEFGLEDPPEYRPNLIQDPINVVEEQQIANNLLQQLNDDQTQVFNTVRRAVENDDEARRYFFVSGAAGTGKTFLYNTIITFMHGQEHKVISIAWTGIAAALLKNGRTVHSQFKLPVPILENSTSSISAQSDIARFIRETKLIIWDEVTMATRTAFELVDRTLKNICGNQRLFGEKCVILGGDFKQCLPVVPDGDQYTIVNQCIKSSHYWNFFENIYLNVNLRLRANELDFLNWLNQLGNGELPNVNFNNNNNVERQHKIIEIPQRCIVNGLNELIQQVFEGQFQGNDIPINKAILTPLNTQCHQINSMILEEINGEAKTYLSIDSIVTDNEAEAANYPQEFLNSLTPPGFAQHELTLKNGSIVMLLRNLNIRANLCNGTRLVIRHLAEHHIQAEIINFNGKLSGKIVFLPKIDFVSASSTLPFVMRRRQFPLRLSYCMTMNKAQGQTFDSLGIYLANPVFSHGQLYVAFSRARAIENVHVCLENTPRQGILRNNDNNQLLAYTPNIVFTEIL